jgi:hypothetical protein
MSPDTDPGSPPPAPRHASPGPDPELDHLEDADALAGGAEPAGADEPEEADEPFIPLGSEEPPEPPEPPAAEAPESFEAHQAHAAIARSLHPPPPPSPPVPPQLRAEADAYFTGAMHAYTEGDLPGARLSLLAVAAIGAPDSAPAAMVFLGVIAARHRDFPQAYLWFARAAAGPDVHWALVAVAELRRLG